MCGSFRFAGVGSLEVGMRGKVFCGVAQLHPRERVIFKYPVGG
jgi:hypothetical protein